MPIDHTTLPPNDHFPPHHIFVGVFFVTKNGKGEDSPYIVTRVDTERRKFWPVHLHTMLPYGYWVPMDISPRERNGFRENAQLIPYDSGKECIDYMLHKAQTDQSFWTFLKNAYRAWQIQRIASKALIARYKQGPHKALVRLGKI